MDRPIPRQRQRGRRATARAGRRGAISAPEVASSTKVWAGYQLLTKSSWDPGQLISTKRVTAKDQLSREDAWHTWDSAPTAHPGNQLAGTREVIRCTALLGRVCSPSTWSPELLGLGKGTKRRPNQVCAFVEHPRNLNLSGLDLGSPSNPGPALDSFPVEQPGAWAVWTRKAHTPWMGANPVQPRRCEHSPLMPVIFLCSVPPHSTTEQVSLNKGPPLLPCARAEIRHWRDLQTEEAKIN